VNAHIQCFGRKDEKWKGRKDGKGNWLQMIMAALHCDSFGANCPEVVISHEVR